MNLQKSLMLGAAFALMSGGAQAADLLMPADSIYDSPLFNFEGFYVGGTLGVGAFPGPGTVGTVGVVAGANFELTDAIFTGVEFQGDALWNGGGFVGFDALFLAKLGGYLTEDMAIYGNVGTGWIANTPSYGIGAGIEMAVAEQLSVRGEVMATGSWGGFINGGKATVGVLWHLD